MYWALVLPFLLAGLLCGLLARAARRSGKPRLVWGSTPLINNRHWSRAMQSAGYVSQTFTFPFYSSINQRADWDRLLDEEWKWCPQTLKPLLAFLQALFAYDVFFISADGFFLGTLPALWRLQAPLLQLAGKKVVFLPYGGDAYVYRRIRSASLLQGLLASYPRAARQQDAVQARLDYWCRHADACVPSVMGIDGFGRWDALLPSALFIDLDEWQASQKQSNMDGSNGPVCICHAPNHRGFKGTEFIVEAVKQLKAEGLQVELVLLEKMQNTQVRQVLQTQADILVEQIIFTGHGLNGLEGMASGLTVVCNLEDEDYIQPLRRWSWFSECPLVSASPETITSTLRELVTRPDLRHQLAAAGREYALKYHGTDSAVFLFEQLIDFVHGRRESLANLYHPLLGERGRHLPRVNHPLVNNRIVY